MNNANDNTGIKWAIGIISSIAGLYITLKDATETTDPSSMGLRILGLLLIIIPVVLIGRALSQQNRGISVILGYTILISLVGFLFFTLVSWIWPCTACTFHKNFHVNILHISDFDQDCEYCSRDEIPECYPVVIEARDFDQVESFNVCNNCKGYGEGILTDDKNRGKRRRVVFDHYFPCTGNYKFEILYATAHDDPRYMRISLDGKIIMHRCCSETTTGWGPESLKWKYQGVFQITEGVRKIEFYTENKLAHIARLRFTFDD